MFYWQNKTFSRIAVNVTCLYYIYSYETGNGISVSESGKLLPGGPEGIQTVVGSFSYPGEDGNLITVTYTVDENGFVAKGNHLPTPPPIPAEILQSLEQNAAEEAAQQAYQQQQQQAAYGQSGSSASYGQESGAYGQTSAPGIAAKTPYPAAGSYGESSAAGGSYGQPSTAAAAPKQPSYQSAGEQPSGPYGQPSGPSYKSQQGYQGQSTSAAYKKSPGSSAY